MDWSALLARLEEQETRLRAAASRMAAARADLLRAEAVDEWNGPTRLAYDVMLLLVKIHARDCVRSLDEALAETQRARQTLG